MKRIPLTQGQFALVDDEDFERISQHKWYARWSSFTKTYYALRNSKTENGHRDTVLMHREVIGAKPGQMVDHKSGNTLDNRKVNLRFCNKSQNAINSGVTRNNTTGFRGVGWHKRLGKFAAKIGVNGHREHLGYFDSPEDAHRAYLDRAAHAFGEFFGEKPKAAAHAVAGKLGKGRSW